MARRMPVLARPPQAGVEVRGPARNRERADSQSARNFAPASHFNRAFARARGPHRDVFSVSSSLTPFLRL